MPENNEIVWVKDAVTGEWEPLDSFTQAELEYYFTPAQED